MERKTKKAVPPFDYSLRYASDKELEYLVENDMHEQLDKRLAERTYENMILDMKDRRNAVFDTTLFQNILEREVPIDVLHLIAIRMDIRDVLRLATQSTGAAIILQDNMFWFKKYQYDFPEVYDLNKEFDPSIIDTTKRQPWRRLYYVVRYFMRNVVYPTLAMYVVHNYSYHRINFVYDKIENYFKKLVHLNDNSKLIGTSNVNIQYVTKFLEKNYILWLTGIFVISNFMPDRLVYLDKTEPKRFYDLLPILQFLSNMNLNLNTKFSVAYVEGGDDDPDYYLKGPFGLSFKTFIQRGYVRVHDDVPVIGKCAQCEVNDSVYREKDSDLEFCGTNCQKAFHSANIKHL